MFNWNTSQSTFTAQSCKFSRRSSSTSARASGGYTSCNAVQRLFKLCLNDYPLVPVESQFMKVNFVWFWGGGCGVKKSTRSQDQYLTFLCNSKLLHKKQEQSKMLLFHNELITPSSALQMNHCPYEIKVLHIQACTCRLLAVESAVKLSMTWKLPENTNLEICNIKSPTSQTKKPQVFHCNVSFLQFQVLSNYNIKVLYSKPVFSEITCKHVISQILLIWPESKRNSLTNILFFRMG